MKFDKFLVALFSRRTIAVILLVAVSLFCLTACELTFEDVICLSLFGCVSFDTCQKMIRECGECGACGDRGAGDEETCAGNACNSLFGCVWEAGLKDCSPSQACSKCEGDEEETAEPRSCDECAIDCMDSCLQNAESED